MHLSSADPIDERQDIGDQLTAAIRTAPARSRARRVPALIRHHNAIARAGKPWHHILPGRGCLGETMQQDDRRSVERPIVAHIEDQSVALETGHALAGHRAILRRVTIDAL